MASATTSLTKANLKRLGGIAESIGQAKSDMATGLIAIGGKLAEAQELLAEAGCKGQFSAWIEKHCGFVRSTAYRYIDAHRAFGNCPTAGHFDMAAILLLSNKTEARAAAIALAKKGTLITGQLAKELIDDAESVAVAQPISEGIGSTDKTQDEPITIDATSREADDGGGQNEGCIANDRGAHERDENGICVKCYDPAPDSVQDSPEAGKEAAKKPRKPETGKPAASEPVAPFRDLACLPPDLFDVFEAFKLVILRHKFAGWQEVALEDVLESLKALGEMAAAKDAD